jgi:hypothetical protein
MSREIPQAAQAIVQIELTAGEEKSTGRPALFLIISHILRQRFSTFFGN